MLKVVSLTKLLSLGILFLPTVRAVVVAKLSILGILFLTSFILALRVVVVVVAKFVKSGILSLIFLILALYINIWIYIYIYIYIFFFSTNHFFLNHLGYLNQQEQVPKSSLSILLSNFLNYFVHFSICQYLIYLH